MAIVKMKFVAAASDREHLDDMLLTCVHSNLLDVEQASNIITEENGGKLINETNAYGDYLQTLKNFGHTVGLELKPKEKSDKKYSPEEVDAFVKEIQTKFQITSDAEVVQLSSDDEIALEQLRQCDFDKMDACQYLNFGFGRLPADSFKKLSLYSDENFALSVLHHNSQYYWLVYVTSDSYALKTRKIFDSLFFEPIEVPKVDTRKLLDTYKDQLIDVYTCCEINNELFNLHQYVAIIDDKNVVAGFVEEDKVKTYEDLFKGQPVDFRVKDPKEEPQCTPPTKLRNNWFFRPFELFVDMYSMPQYYDFDPTVFVGITYCLLFGIMFGDLGQGLVLLILGMLLEKKKHNRLMGVVGRVGITSMIFGFLFGSVFGYEDLLNPIHQSLFHVRSKLFEVMAGSSTMILLLGAVAIGAVLILITMIMNTANNIKHHKWGEVLFSQNGVAGFVFYAFILSALGSNMLGLGVNLMSPITIILFIVLPVICFLMKEPFTQLIEGKGIKPKQGWGGFFVESFFECFEIALSFVTNSMSYLRVGGFVLSHAGMMLVVMTLVQMTGNAGPVVLVIGNIFVMGLEGLIVGIQTLRLEYYEMFSRYYTGGGRRFKTLSVVEE